MSSQGWLRTLLSAGSECSMDAGPLESWPPAFRGPPGLWRGCWCCPACRVCKYHSILPDKVLGNAHAWAGGTCMCLCWGSVPPPAHIPVLRANVQFTLQWQLGGPLVSGCASPPLQVCRETVTRGRVLAAVPGMCGHGPELPQGPCRGESRGRERLSDLPMVTQPVRGSCSV